MYEKKINESYRCPIEYALDVFGGKWNARIFCLMVQSGSMRYSDFRGRLPGISDPVLASTLKTLIKNGIVERKSYDEMPIRVEYNLTEKGVAVIPIFRGLCTWSATHATPDSEAILPQCKGCEFGAPPVYPQEKLRVSS